LLGIGQVAALGTGSDQRGPVGLPKAGMFCLLIRVLFWLRKFTELCISDVGPLLVPIKMPALYKSTILIPIPPCGLVPHPVTPVGCPATQLSSDTLPGDSIRSHRVRAQSYRDCPPNFSRQVCLN